MTFPTVPQSADAKAHPMRLSVALQTSSRDLALRPWLGLDTEYWMSSLIAAEQEEFLHSYRCGVA